MSCVDPRLLIGRDEQVGTQTRPRDVEPVGRRGGGHATANHPQPGAAPMTVPACQRAGRSRRQKNDPRTDRQCQGTDALPERAGDHRDADATAWRAAWPAIADLSPCQFMSDVTAFSWGP